MDRLVTLFGGGGFLGRYVAQALYRTGVRVRIAQRDPRQAFFLKPLGALGQTQFVGVDIRNKAQVAEAVKGSYAVVNLVGILKGDMEAVHVDGARNVAEAAAAEKAASLVHISAIGADPDSPSEYGRSKGQGEKAVRAAFPGATIVRPSILFGREDNFVNGFARMARLMPVLPVIKPGTRFQPVYCADVARVVTAAALDPRTHASQTYELGGPQVITMREINEWICKTTGRNRHIFNIPDAIARLIAKFGGWVPGAPITHDQWLMLQNDNVVAEDAKGFEEFGISPAPMGAVSEGWLTPYRRHGRFGAKTNY